MENIKLSTFSQFIHSFVHSSSKYLSYSKHKTTNWNINGKDDQNDPLSCGAYSLEEYVGNNSVILTINQ